MPATVPAVRTSPAPKYFATYNAFFFRKLKPASRPIYAAANSVVFPADGQHLGFQDVSQAQGIFVKGQKFALLQLLGDSALAERYQHGTLVLSRLCPVDYHRFQFSAAGVPVATQSLGRPLYSVSPVALRRNISYLWQNKRTLTLLETPDLGTVIIMEIGATNVGSIQQTFTPRQSVTKGSEKGYFAFGGSSTLTIFDPGRVRLSDDLVRESGQQREMYARMGDVMGQM